MKMNKSLQLFRRKINQIEMIRGPNKILLTLEEVTFVHPSLSNKVSNICQDNAHTLIHDKCNKKKYVYDFMRFV